MEMHRRVDAQRRDRLVGQFERHRPHLRAVAYRMLGSLTEADDAVQEAWLRLDRRDPGGDADLRGWLTVVVGRICLDMLRSRRSRREQYAGSWLPEPIVSGTLDRTLDQPEHQAVLADSVGLALMVVLETLTPSERLAFVLHDVFAVPFGEIAGVIDRTPEATRQLASRARRRVRSSASTPDADLDVQKRVVDAFLSAARDGDFRALVSMLHPDAVLRTDTGGRTTPSRPPIVGADAVARELVTGAARFGALGRPAIVNGAPGIVARMPGRPPIGVAGFTVRDGRIVAIDVIADPAKLRRVVELPDKPVP
jgi:RNA polymerase sigma-70 factor (ECF subfamily)